MASQDRAFIRQLLGEGAASLSPADLAWMSEEAERIQARSRALAEAAKTDLDFAAMVGPATAEPLGESWG
jgi:hypothetical protein